VDGQFGVEVVLLNVQAHSQVVMSLVEVLVQPQTFLVAVYCLVVN